MGQTPKNGVENIVPGLGHTHKYGIGNIVPDLGQTQIYGVGNIVPDLDQKHKYDVENIVPDLGQTPQIWRWKYCIMICVKNYIKKYYWSRPSTFNLDQLLSVDNRTELCNLEKFIHLACKARNNLV